MKAKKTIRGFSVTFIIFCAVLSGVAGDARADAQEDARESYQQGQVYFEAGDYNKAIKAFERADRLAPAALLDYNIALSFEAQGNEAQALKYYRRFLKRDPNSSIKGEVKASIARLESTAKANPPNSRSNQEGPKDNVVVPMDQVPTEPQAQSGQGRASGQSAAAGQNAPVVVPQGMERVGAIDIGSVRDRYLGAEAAPTAEDPNVVQQPTAADLGMGQPPAPQAASNYSVSQPPPYEQVPPPQDKPIYKKWFFWVVVGVAAVVLYDIASEDDRSAPNVNTAAFRRGNGNSGAPSAGGATLFSF